MGKKQVIGALLVVGVAAGYLFWRFVIDAGNSGPPTWGPETTFITDEAFLRDDGYVDYLAAINDWRSEDVRPTDNACVDLFHAFQPQDDDRVDWQARWQMMTDDPVPEGPFFYELTDEYDLECRDEAMLRPWADDEFPEVIRWINDNQQVAKIFATAARKPRYYYPLYMPPDGGDLVMGVLLLLPHDLRAAARFLAARALNHLANNRGQECLDDIYTMHGLARHVSQNGFLLEHLVGIAIHGIATETERIVIESGKLDSMQITGHLSHLDDLPEFNDLVDSFNIGERYSGLSSVQYARQHGMNAFDIGSSGKQAVPVVFDVDAALKLMNEGFDIVVEATQQPDFAGQSSHCEEFESKMHEIEKQYDSTAFWAKSVLGGTRSRGEVMGSIVAGMILPASHSMIVADTRRIALTRLSKLAFLLEQYRLKNGEFPDSLTQLQLAPQSLIGVDPFTGEPVRYKKSSEGFRLYVCGSNMRDDDGVQRDDENFDDPGDDWRLDVNYAGS